VSGIFGAMRLDGAPVDPAVLRRAAARLATRAPDGVRTWRRGPVGFVHALLRTHDDPTREAGIACVDERLWIAADARLDGRDGLVDALGSAVGPRARRAGDAELALLRYASRGPEGLAALQGDFALAIWDARERRLVLARDAFGVKPLFWARAGSALVFGSDAACVLACEGVDAGIDEESVADFLVAGENPRLDASFTRGLHRLPPGHRLVADAGGVRRARVPVLADLREGRAPRRPAEVVEALDAHLRRAVRDRLPGGTAALLLSGGVDSTAVAASACAERRRGGAEADLVAFTFVFERLVPHEEGPWARRAADALGIPHRTLALDDCELYAHLDAPRAAPVQPSIEALAAGDELARAAGDRARVVLTGEGGDPALHTPALYWPRLVRRGRLVRAAREAWRHARDFGRPPPLGLRTRLRRRGAGPSEDPFERAPDWLDPGFAERLEIAERWRAWRAGPPVDPDLHPTRPETVACLRGYQWTNEFEFLDPGATGHPLEFRHPFFDLRLLRFLLELPAIPWCVHKEIVRRAMAGRLPDAVRRRPKAPLRAAPAFRFPEARARALAERVRSAPGIERFVRVEALCRALRLRDPRVPGGLERCFAAAGLAEWLHGRAAARPPIREVLRPSRSRERMHARPSA